MATERKRLIWPPKVGTRIHVDTGHASSSWSAEVRAIVDEEVAVLKRWRKHKGWHTYEILEKIDVELRNDATRRYFDPECGFFEGPLPKAKSED